MTEFPLKQWKDYELLDSGRGEKLERFGAVVMSRPEPKALWDKSMSDAEWRRMSHFAFRLTSAQNGRGGRSADTKSSREDYARNAGSGAIEDRGTWERLKKADDQWFISYKGSAASAGPAGLQFRLRLGLTAFKHVGVFPEQAPNWEFIYSQVRRIAGASLRSSERTAETATDQRPKVLNLFAYTGAASLAAKAAGADVTHLDSIKQVVTWARANMEASGLDGIRWIVEDAKKFVEREARRGNLYDGIILDPPAYGHGPNGEKWKLDESLFALLQNVGRILRPENSFMVLNLYSNGYSAALGETLVRQAFGRDFAGPMTSGELALNDRFGKALPLSIYVRLSL